jgi:hypothetical protein
MTPELTIVTVSPPVHGASGFYSESNPNNTESEGGTEAECCDGAYASALAKSPSGSFFLDDHERDREPDHNRDHEPSPKRRLFFNHHKQSSQKGPKSKKSPSRHFHLRPSLHLLANASPSRRDCKHEPRSMSASSLTTSVERESNDSIGESSSLQQQLDPDPDTNNNMNINSTNNNIIKDEPKHEDGTKSGLLFQDNMDIVAFQEWPLVRKRRYFPHQSPSSVCGLSVETIATKLGRSPVVVSFDTPSRERDNEVAIAAPVPIHGRIQTGIVRSAKRNGDDEPPRKGEYLMTGNANVNHKKCMACSNSTDADHSAADSILSAIESTLSHMMCID